ncbi:MAG: WYL domain-containing protein [Actinomycetes bacterium]
MTERVDRTERLLNLVICLMATHGTVSRSDIQRQIPGYGESASPTAFERMFERDKDELRSMGIPIETVTDASGEVQGYRIPRDSYVLENLDFTFEERAAIAVAAQVWGTAAIGPVAGTAVRKLEAVDSDGWSPAALAGSVQVTSSDAALLPLMSAIRADRIVTFAYRTPADPEARQREVSPWGLRASSGRWFLVGFDEQRDAVRTFRLSRIAGPVTVTARTRTHPPAPDFDIATVNRPDDEPTVTATVRVAPGRVASLRRMAAPGPEGAPADELTIQASSRDGLISLICAAGADAVALAPQELVADVVASLAAVRDAHSSGAADGRVS